MSELSIAVVAEGKTDVIIIEGILKVLIENAFTMRILQPEEDMIGGAGTRGGGWTGVYKWCEQFARQPAILSGVDMLIVHVDADVAATDYASGNIRNPPQQNLPCDCPCPPAMDSVNNLRSVVSSWLPRELGFPIILCIPAQSIEAWVIAARYNGNSLMPSDVECIDASGWLGRRPLNEGNRLVRGSRKIGSEFRRVADILKETWNNVESSCASARLFGETVRQVRGG